MKSGLPVFAADARDNGGQLQRDATTSSTPLELLSNEMLDRLASCGVRIDDTPFIELAPESRRARLEAVIEAAIRRGEVSEDDVFDTDYVADAGHQSDPVRNPLLRLCRPPCPPDPRPV